MDGRRNSAVGGVGVRWSGERERSLRKSQRNVRHVLQEDGAPQHTSVTIRTGAMVQQRSSAREHNVNVLDARTHARTHKLFSQKILYTVLYVSQEKN